MTWAAERRALLIADNIETCLEACADLLPRLAAAGAAVLTTSREPINVPAELVWRLAALDVAASDASAEELAASPGVALFRDRAANVRPDVDLAPHLGEIAEICGRLDGLPLAIEIAAARVAVLTVPEILAGLDDRFALVRSNERHLPERQRTLRGLLQGSYDLLDDTEKATFRCLGVFAGPFALRAASIVVTGGDDSAGSAVLLAADVPGLVWSLVDKSLVTIDQSVDGTRYRLLESVREFAFSLLVESGESEQAVLRAAQDLASACWPLAATRSTVAG